MCELFDEQPMTSLATVAVPNGQYQCYRCTPIKTKALPPARGGVRAEELKAAAERIVAWVNYEFGLREFATITVDEGVTMKAHAVSLAKAALSPADPALVASGGDPPACSEPARDERDRPRIEEIRDRLSNKLDENIKRSGLPGVGEAGFQFHTHALSDLVFLLAVVDGLWPRTSTLPPARGGVRAEEEKR